MKYKTKSDTVKVWFVQKNIHWSGSGKMGHRLQSSSSSSRLVACFSHRPHRRKQSMKWLNVNCKWNNCWKCKLKCILWLTDWLMRKIKAIRAVDEGFHSGAYWRWTLAKKKMDEVTWVQVPNRWQNNLSLTNWRPLLATRIIFITSLLSVLWFALLFDCSTNNCT